MILAGDIITLGDYDPLDQLLQKWKKPVLYVTGNHEYYTKRPMNEEDKEFKAWLESKHPHVKLLLDEEVSYWRSQFLRRHDVDRFQRRGFADHGNRPGPNK
jgi:predicted phosphodiesterase